MTVKQELIAAIVTFASTIVTGSIIWDLFAGIVTYSVARLFYHYFHQKMIDKIDQIRKWWANRKKSKEEPEK